MGIQEALSSDWWELAAWCSEEAEDTDDFLPEEESEEMREVIEVKTDGLECIQPELDVASRL